MNDQLRPVIRKMLDMEDSATPVPASYRMTPRDKTLMRDLRYLMKENQTQFWRRFGVAQSSGSRFERGVPVPLPVLLLIRLYFLRYVSDGDLQAVRSPEYESGALGGAALSPARTRGPSGSP